ncbi:MAG: HD domain-containing protein [Gemmatimonadales bacterium]|nr:HD domain-containing protein [Gemmatimonadales bacterium]
MNQGHAPQLESILLVVGAELREPLREFLGREGFAVECAEVADAVIGLLAERRFNLALIDASWSDLDTATVVPEALEADPDLAVVVLARMEDATTAAICLQQGAFEYVSHPVDDGQLRLAVDRALRRRGTEVQTQQISVWLKQELVERTRELERERQKLQQINVATLTALINALEAKDPDFVGHSVRVADSAASIATEMGLSDDDIEAVRAAGRLHDLGKIGIRDEVLRKRGPLTVEEQQHIRDQVLIGFRILAPLSHLGAVRQYVRSHHEHWDGGGYPDGLKGVEIPIGARIVFAAEIYDAITSPRPYQDRLTRQAALAQLQKLAGTKLDPAVVEALASVVSRRRSLEFVRDDESRQR